MTLDDVVSTLTILGLLHNSKNGYFLISHQALRDYTMKVQKKGNLRVKDECLKWDPVLLKRMIGSHGDSSVEPNEDECGLDLDMVEQW